MRATYLEMTHPDTAATARVPEGLADHYRAKGWQTLSEQVGARKVAEVVAEAERDPTAAAQILAAERAGANRTTLVSQLTKIADPTNPEQEQ